MANMVRRIHSQDTKGDDRWETQTHAGCEDHLKLLLALIPYQAQAHDERLANVRYK